MSDNKIGGVDSYITSFLKARKQLIASGNKKPTTQQIVAAMNQNQNQGVQNDTIQGFHFEYTNPTTKYMPPVPPNSAGPGGAPHSLVYPDGAHRPEPEATTKYMPPVPPQPSLEGSDIPTTKYMPPVPPQPSLEGSDIPTTKYMPPVPPQPSLEGSDIPTTKYMPPVPPENAE